MFQEAITYLKDSDDAVETVLLGGFLTLFGFLLVPLLPVFGYLLRVLDRTSDSERRAGETAPSFGDWEALFRDGLKVAAVGVAYLLVPAVLAVLLFGTGFAALAAGRDGAGALTLLAGVGVTGAAWLAVWYVLPAALTRLAVERRVAAAFELGSLAPVLRNGTYATGWLVALVVLVVGGALVGGLGSVPVLGWLLAPFVAFSVNVVAFAIYGWTYRDAVGDVRNDAPIDEHRPAV